MTGVGARSIPADLPVVVLGLMGSGKTSLGQVLARRLGRPLRDSDADLQSTTGRPAADIAAQDGRAALHFLEAAHMLAALSERPAPVVAAAASVVERPDCCKSLGQAFVVWLDLDPEVLAARFESEPHRPIYGMVPADVLREQRRQRAEAFRHIADLVLTDPAMTPDELAKAVEEAILHLD